MRHLKWDTWNLQNSRNTHLTKQTHCKEKIEAHPFNAPTKKEGIISSKHRESLIALCNKAGCRDKKEGRFLWRSPSWNPWDELITTNHIRKKHEKTWESWDSAVLLLHTNSSNNFASYPIMPVFPHRDRSISILLWSWIILKKDEHFEPAKIDGLESRKKRLFHRQTLQNSLVLEAKKTNGWFGCQWLFYFPGCHGEAFRGLLLVESQNSLRRRRFQIDQANSIAHRNLRSKDGCCCWYGYVANLWGIKLVPIFWAILLAIYKIQWITTVVATSWGW